MRMFFVNCINNTTHKQTGCFHVFIESREALESHVKAQGYSLSSVIDCGGVSWR